VPKVREAKAGEGERPHAAGEDAPVRRLQNTRTDYHRAYYRMNAKRRRVQRLASKYGAPSEWRLWL
jgi:hypothetical protein